MAEPSAPQFPDTPMSGQSVYLCGSSEQGFPFFDLPAELRIRIFELVFRTRYASSVRHLAWNRGCLKVFHLPALLQVSSRFWREAWPVFLNVNTFVLDASKMMTQLMKHRLSSDDDQQWCHLQSTQLRIECGQHRVSTIMPLTLWGLQRTTEVSSSQATLIIKLSKDRLSILVFPKDKELRLRNRTQNEINLILAKRISTSPTETLNGLDLLHVCTQIVNGPRPGLEAASRAAWKGPSP